jgi:hypothetical protein
MAARLYGLDAVDAEQNIREFTQLRDAERWLGSSVGESRRHA